MTIDQNALKGGLLVDRVNATAHYIESNGSAPLTTAETLRQASGALVSLQARVDALKEANEHANKMQALTQDRRNAAEAEVTRLRAQVKEMGEVTPLEWEAPFGSKTLIRADTIIGTYRVWTHKEANSQWFWTLTNIGVAPIVQGETSSHDVAKIAAEEDYEARIRSALVAASPQREGLVLVPVEPTKEMILAGRDYAGPRRGLSVSKIYLAMLAAAPATC